MPIYEYECTKCRQQTEALQKFSDQPLTRCESCGGKLRKLISHSTFHLKGSGWYVTDYASKTGYQSGANQDKSAESSEKKSSTESKDSAQNSKKNDQSSKTPKEASSKKDAS